MSNVWAQSPHPFDRPSSSSSIAEVGKVFPLQSIWPTTLAALPLSDKNGGVSTFCRSWERKWNGAPLLLDPPPPLSQQNVMNNK